MLDSWSWGSGYKPTAHEPVWGWWAVRPWKLEVTLGREAGLELELIGHPFRVQMF